MFGATPGLRGQLVGSDVHLKELQVSVFLLCTERGHHKRIWLATGHLHVGSCEAQVSEVSIWNPGNRLPYL